MHVLLSTYGFRIASLLFLGLSSSQCNAIQWRSVSTSKNWRVA